MIKLQYKDLTRKQKEFICNGCGGKGSLIPVPDFIFGADCNHHDFKYWRGATRQERKRVDKQFFIEMLIDAIKLIAIKPLYVVLFYTFWAIVFYAAVRIRGYKYFNFEKQKTLEDLQKEMGV